jgi:cell division protein FtsB
MQKNRELHKQVVQLKSENEKLTKEKDKYKKIVERYKSK